MLRLMAEADFAQKGVQSGPYGSETSFTVPSLNVFIQQAKQQVRNTEADPLVVQATALSFAVLLSQKTDSTADSYVVSLASETQMP